MIKLLVVLAVVSQISAFKYSQDSVTYIRPDQSTTNSNFKFSYQPAKENQRILTASGFKSRTSSLTTQNLGFVKPTMNSAPITRNLVARGKYPVTLQSSGPAPDKKIPVVTSHLRTPVQEKPTVRLQAKIPAPKTIAHSCTCFKTIVKPRVQQHLITVPTIQRYIETLHRPVIENIHYEAYPVRCLESADEEVLTEKNENEAFRVQEVSGIQIPSQIQKNSGIQTFELANTPNLELSKIQAEKTQLIEIPRVQFVQNQQTQETKIPHVHFIQKQNPPTAEIPRVHFIESGKSEAFEIPQTQLFENKKPQVIEIPNTQFVENNKAETIELPRLEFLQAQKLQTVEIPRIQMEESPKVHTVKIPQQGGTISLSAAPFSCQLSR